MREKYELDGKPIEWDENPTKGKVKFKDKVEEEIHKQIENEKELEKWIFKKLKSNPFAFDFNNNIISFIEFICPSKDKPSPIGCVTLPNIINHQQFRCFDIKINRNVDDHSYDSIELVSIKNFDKTMDYKEFYIELWCLFLTFKILKIYNFAVIYSLIDKLRTLSTNINLYKLNFDINNFDLFFKHIENIVDKYKNQSLELLSLDFYIELNNTHDTENREIKEEFGVWRGTVFTWTMPGIAFAYAYNKIYYNKIRKAGPQKFIEDFTKLKKLKFSKGKIESVADQIRKYNQNKPGSELDQAPKCYTPEMMQFIEKLLIKLK